MASCSQFCVSFFTTPKIISIVTKQTKYLQYQNQQFIDMIRICCTGVVVSSNIPRISQNKSCKLPKGIPFRFNVYFILRFALLTCFVTQLYTDFRAHIPVIHTRIGAFVCMWVWVQCSHSHCNYLYMGTMLSFFLSLPVVFVSLIFNYFLDISDSVRKMGG